MPLAWLMSILAAFSLPFWAGRLQGGLQNWLQNAFPDGAEAMRSGQLAAGFAWPPFSELPVLLWPLGLGLLLSIVLGWSLRRLGRRLGPRLGPRLGLRLSHWLPAGDLWWPVAACGRWLWCLGRGILTRLARLQETWIAWWIARAGNGLTGLNALTRAEGWLRRQLAMLLLAVAVGLAGVLLLNAKSTPLWP